MRILVKISWSDIFSKTSSPILWGLSRFSESHFLFTITDYLQLWETRLCHIWQKKFDVEKLIDEPNAKTVQFDGWKHLSGQKVLRILTWLDWLSLPRHSRQILLHLTVSKDDKKRKIFPQINIDIPNRPKAWRVFVNYAFWQKLYIHVIQYAK